VGRSSVGVISSAGGMVTTEGDVAVATAELQALINKGTNQLTAQKKLKFAFNIVFFMEDLLL